MKNKPVPENTDLVTQYLLDNCSFKVKCLTKPNILAKIDVDFVVFKIKGFMIRKKDEQLWVNPPSFPVPPPAKWPRIFWSEFPDFWNKLSEKILAAYKKEAEGIVNAEEKTWEQIADSIEY